MINVLIVEDSRVVSEYLYYILSKDPQIQVIGNVSNGKLAVEFIRDHKPDVITMDIEMPVMDGLEATRIIMSTTPIPILIVTASRNTQEISTSIEALAAGALAVIEKPVGIGHPKEAELARNLIGMIKLMSEVHVIARKPKPSPKPAITAPPAKDRIIVKPGELPEVIAIGVSSGGPQALKIVFAGLTKRFPVPIVVVQHITKGFLQGMVDWLGNGLDIAVKIAEDGEYLLPGQIYFAPDGFHTGVSRALRIRLETNGSKSGFCPSVAHLFQSITAEFGNRSMGILLTGMGSDGAHELKNLRDSGAITIAQSKESALIFGMPGVAIQLGGATYVRSAEEICALLKDMEMNAVKK